MQHVLDAERQLESAVKKRASLESFSNIEVFDAILGGLPHDAPGIIWRFILIRVVDDYDVLRTDELENAIQYLPNLGGAFVAGNDDTDLAEKVGIVLPVRAIRRWARW